MQDHRAGVAHGVGICVIEERNVVASREQAIDQIAVEP